MPRKERLAKERDKEDEAIRKGLIGPTPEEKLAEDLAIKEFIADKYNITDPKHFAFYVEFLKSGVAYKAYQKACSPGMSMNVAAVMASTIMKKYKVSFIEWLEYAGHGTDTITEALNKLKSRDVEAYLKHITKLKQLDVKRIEHSGAIDIPVINITNQKVDNE